MSAVWSWCQFLSLARLRVEHLSYVMTDNVLAFCEIWTVEGGGREGMGESIGFKIFRSEKHFFWV